MGKQDANAVAWNLPVSLDATQSKQWPGFIMDLLPQGYGRQELLRQLDLPPNAGESADWSLLIAGASNPIGNCRDIEPIAYRNETAFRRRRYH